MINKKNFENLKVKWNRGLEENVIWMKVLVINNKICDKTLNSISNLYYFPFGSDFPFNLKPEC